MGLAELQRQVTPDLLRVAGVQPTGKEAAALAVVERYAPPSTWHGRGEPRAVSRCVRITSTLGGEAAKGVVYEASVRAGMADLLAAIGTGRAPRVTGANAWQSLATALAAQEASVRGCSVVPAVLHPVT